MQTSRQNVKKSAAASLRPVARKFLAAFKLQRMQSKSPIEQAIARQDWSLARKFSQTAIEALWFERFVVSVGNRMLNLVNYKKQIDQYRIKSKQTATKPKIAIYTAITGKYDSLKLPEVLDERFDYFVYSDGPVPDSGIYQVRPTSYFNEDPTRSARFIKTHPHWLFRDYDIAIWIDANVMITGDIYPIVETFIDSGKPLAAMPHPHRTTVYQELEACLAFKKDNAEEMIEQVERYRAAGFNGEGLIESSLLLFDLHQPTVATFLDFWWKEIDSYSRRDQLSAGYALNQTNIDWLRLSVPPHSIRDHPLFVITPHAAAVNEAMVELNKKVAHAEIDPFEIKPFAKVKSAQVAAQKNREVDIVLCVHNAPDDVTKCLASLAQHKNSKQRLIIVDDGSGAPTAAILKSFVKKHSWAKLIRHEKAMGYTKAANAGLKASTGELVILLNSDTVVTDSWVEKMADAVFGTPGAGMVGPLSSAASVQSLPDYQSTKNQTAINDLPEGVSIEEMNTYCEQWAPAGYTPFATMLHGFCLGITREVINTVGLFDEKHFPRGYGEENDYCFRAVNAGFGLVVAVNTYVFHAKSKSYSSDVRVSLMQQGTQALRDLYGKRRITNAIRSMQDNPTLVRMRGEAKKLYK